MDELLSAGLLSLPYTLRNLQLTDGILWAEICVRCHDQITIFSRGLHLVPRSNGRLFGDVM